MIPPPSLFGSFEGLHTVAENTPASCLPVAVGNRADKADGPSRGERVVTSVGRRHRFRVNSFANGSWKLTLARSPSPVPVSSQVLLSHRQLTTRTSCQLRKTNNERPCWWERGGKRTAPAADIVARVSGMAGMYCQAGLIHCHAAPLGGKKKKKNLPLPSAVKEN